MKGIKFATQNLPTQETPWVDCFSDKIYLTFKEQKYQSNIMQTLSETRVEENAYEFIL